MGKWKRKPQEVEGSYSFSGRRLATQGLVHSLSPEEITAILIDLRMAVSKHDGLDYLQVYENPDGRRIFIVDSLNKTMKTDGSYTPSEIKENDHFTMMLPEEY